VKFIFKLLLVAIVLYGGAIAVLYFVQDRLLYRPPESFRRTPASVGFLQAEEVVLTTADGERLVAWYVPPKAGKSIILFFHGNAEVLAWRVPRFRRLIEDGSGLLAMSFRGYAGSTGSPSEKGIMLDGEAAYDFAAARYPEQKIVFWGYSLGSGVAVQLAARHRVARLILEAPYSAAVDVAAALMPFAPVRLLMRDQFHSDAYIRSVYAPVLIMHGEHDEAISIRFGERMFDLANEPKCFVRFPEGNHTNLDDLGAVKTVQRFVAAAGC
jgi:uncharacterized protein